MVDFAVTAVVVCDDIRKEITSKDILIGAYGGGILVPYLPASLQIAIWIELTPAAPGRVELDIRITLPGVQKAAIGLLLIGEVPSSESTAINTPQFMCPISAEGDLEISIRRRDAENWQIMKTKSVRLGSPQQPPKPMEIHIGLPPSYEIGSTGPSPIASEQPSEQSLPDVPATKPRPARRRPSSRRSGRTPAPE